MVSRPQPKPRSKEQDVPIENLINMHQEVEGQLFTRIDTELAELEERVRTLREYKQRMAGLNAQPTSQKGIKIAPKYRNPENPHETWAGRGMYPKWLDQKLKAGAKLDDFKI